MIHRHALMPLSKSHARLRAPPPVGMAMVPPAFISTSQDHFSDTFMVVIDAHSKWMEACIMSSINATKTIEQLRCIFAAHGLPRKVVSDNGPTFTSEQFRSFMSMNGISHSTTAPYTTRPATDWLNGRSRLSEAYSGHIDSRKVVKIPTYPHGTTGVSPSSLLMGRRLRSRLDRFFPNVSKKVDEQQRKQILQKCSSKSARTFQPSDPRFQSKCVF